MNPPPPEDKARVAKLKDSSHLANMALPEARQQSYEEIYGPPENVLEIEVCYSPLSYPATSYPIKFTARRVQFTCLLIRTTANTA
jgi:hypothetical protein